ncbi:MAG: 4-hydroxy-tetrahydrodipicolinate reductase [Bacillota bacterium]
MKQKVKVIVSGAAGRMGQAVCKGILGDSEMDLVGAVDTYQVGVDIGSLLGVEETGVLINGNLMDVIDNQSPDVMVDFTNAQAAAVNARMAVKSKVCPVIGTTGMTEETLAELHKLCEENGVGALIAPNFALGAVLMMRFAAEAAKYFPLVEIIELHHDEKLDAPSGTALRTAELITQEREQTLPRNAGKEIFKVPCARGSEYQGIRIHSVRLPGLVAHQEVILGGIGQTLTIRHDSMNRDSFIPGVLLAVRKICAVKGVIFGLESLL